MNLTSLEKLENKKIALLGLGIENLALAKFLAKRSFEFTICDFRSPPRLGQRYRILKNKARWQLGKNFNKKLFHFDIVFRSPGWPLFCPGIQEALKKGAVVTSPIKLFFELCPSPIIGVSGTKGKGTTATLIYKMLKGSGRKVFLGGNIGKAPFDFLEKLTSRRSWVVLELSSFQLEDLRKSPDIAVITNITSEHLATADPLNPNYHRSEKDYFEAKRNIMKFQTKNNWAVLNFDDLLSRNLTQKVPSRVFYFSRKRELPQGIFIRSREREEIVFRVPGKENHLCKVDEVKLLGEHNLENLCAAAAASLLAGASLAAIKKVATTFRGLEHHLELVRQFKGVKYYNDSFSTTPESALMAIRALKDSHLILILGGAEKGSNYTPLAREMTRHKIKTIILIGQTALKIEKTIRKVFGKRPPPHLIKGLRAMKSIVKVSKKNAKKGDIILFSPASASFDMFKNYKERGMLFKNIVQKL